MPKSSTSDITTICLNGNDVTDGEPSLDKPLQNYERTK